jgi:hypothetical protein
MEIQTEDYRVSYNEATHTIEFHGFLQLNGLEEYAPIVELLNRVVDEEPVTIRLNVRELELLNSSGINMMSKFVIKVRQKKTIQMIVQGSQEIEWQGKSLTNLQRLMPSLTLEWEPTNED